LVALYINTVAFNDRDTSRRAVLLGARIRLACSLFVPCGAGASVISVRHRIYEKDHLVRESGVIDSFLVHIETRWFYLKVVQHKMCQNHSSINMAVFGKA
jgi:hypothetical protein